MPVLFGSDSIKVAEGNIGLPLSRAAAEAIRVRMRAQVGPVFIRPGGRARFGDASAVLRVIDASAVAAVPEGDACSVTNCLRDGRPYRIQAKRLAVSAVTEIEATFLVTMKICQRERTCSNCEGFK